MRNKCISYETPNVPFPKNIGACITLRSGGYSAAPFNSFNMGLHVGDDPNSVNKNRYKLLEDQQLNSIFWLNQVHGVDVAAADELHFNQGGQQKKLVDADASYTTKKNTACAIMVADCLPVLVTNSSGSVVGAAHAGWRGLCHGVIDKLITAMPIQPKDAIVWLGPCISKAHFQVGREVYEAFQENPFFNNLETKKAFRADKKQHYLADLHLLAQMQLESLGVKNIYASKSCAYADSEQYFSYRREKNTGRMAALIWIKNT